MHINLTIKRVNNPFGTHHHLTYYFKSHPPGTFLPLKMHFCTTLLKNYTYNHNIFCCCDIFLHSFFLFFFFIIRMTNTYTFYSLIHRYSAFQSCLYTIFRIVGVVQTGIRELLLYEDCEENERMSKNKPVFSFL